MVARRQERFGALALDERSYEDGTAPVRAATRRDSGVVTLRGSGAGQAGNSDSMRAAPAIPRVA